MKNAIAKHLDKGLIACGLLGAEIVSKHALRGNAVFVRKTHLHHWMIGAALGIAGLTAKASKNTNVRAFGSCVSWTGAGIFLHDIWDFLGNFRFVSK
jgi:hypothetical protein